jgi:DNA-directed RNA polymerase beta subunit
MQKAVAGILLKDSDMPFTKDGVRPDAILNPHCMPSRMTVGQLIEMLVSGYCAEKGCQVDGTIFRKVDMDAIANELEEMGCHRYGYERLFSGITGEYIDTEIFMVPVFYQRLQKFAIDARYHVTQGPSDPLTMIPVEGGKANSGGLRIGELEYSALVAQGVSRVMKEKLYDHSDAYDQYYCHCGKEVIVNTHQNPPILKCRYCGDAANISRFPTSYSAKLFRHELQGMGVGMRVHGEPYVFEVPAEDISAQSS